MTSNNVLERLVVELIGNDDQLKATFDATLREARKTADEIGKAFGEAFTKRGSDSVEAAAKATADVITNVGTAAKAASADLSSLSSERLVKDIEALNRQMRENHEAIRAGNITRAEYRRILGSQRDEMRDLLNAYNSSTRATTDKTRVDRQASDATRELDERIKSLSNEVRTQRNLWAARITDDETFRRSTEALHQEMRELADTAELSGDQMRKLTGDIAYAQRGLDSSVGAMSRGGLAWTAQIALQQQFGDTLRNIGPAGNAAAMGISALAPVFTSLRGPVQLTSETLAGFARNLGNITRLLPLLAGAGAVAATTALWRMANSASSMATELEVAAHRTGLTTEALQEYHYAAEQAGVSAERFNTVTQRILRRAADAAAGNKGLADAFNALNVSITDANGELRSADDLLGQVADGLFQVENQGERVALAFKIMDTEGSQMLNFLQAGSEGLAEMREQARDLGLVISGDTIMSLSQFGTQVSQLQRQFEVARIEIAAAFLPVLQNVLMPLIQRTVIPWLQSLATRVQDFRDRLIEVGPAGDEFRNTIVKWIDPLWRFGRIGSGVIQILVGIGQGAVAAAASLGTALGELSVQIEAFFRQFSRLGIDSYTWTPTTWLSNLESIARDLTSGAAGISLDVFDGDRILDEALKAGLTYAQAANMAIYNGVEAITEGVGGGGMGSMIVEALMNQVAEGVNTGLSDALLSAPGVDELGSAIASSIASGITGGVAEVLDEAIASIPEVVYTNATAGEAELAALVESRLAREARETERLQRLQDYAREAELAHLAEVRTWYEQHYADMERRQLYVDIAAAAGVGQSTGMLEGNLLGIDQAEVDRLAAYNAQQERVAKANADIAESARLARVAAGRMFDQDLMRGTGQIADLTAAFERLTDTRTPLERLRDELVAFGEASAAAAGAVKPMIDEIDRLTKGVTEAAKVYDQLGKATPVDRARPVSDGSRGAFAANFEAMQEAALSAFNDVQARMDEFFGRTESEFDQMRAAAQAALDAGTISAEDFARALADIDAAEAATRLVDTLGQIETGLHAIGGAVGGSIGGLAKNLGDAVGVAKQFASGDITGGIISTVTMIASGIADMVSANGEWARSVDQLSDRYRNLSRETVEALTKSRTETRWFLFIPYKVRVVDESATSEAMRVAQDFLSALDGALKSADFGADFNLGIDRLIQTELINGFMLSPEIQAAITAFTAAMEAGDLNLARGIYEGIEAATRRQHEVLREMFPDLYRNTEAAKDYADEMERAKRATQDMLAAIAGNQLERAFATGAIGLERYARELQRLTQQGITSDYARQEQELRKLISEAREAQADPAYVRALEEQLATLGDAFRDALEQGAFEANQTIRDLLGTSVGVIQDVMRSAFDTSTVDDFLSNWSAGITDVTRRGLITAFLESAQMKTALDNIGQMIADAVLDGVVTESELKAIRDAYTAVGEDAAQFWEVLDRLGLGFDGLADTVDTLNDSMRNVPSIFKATQAQWDAMQPSIPSSAAFTASSSSAGAGATHVTEVHFHGDVYGLDDFDDKVNAAVDGRANRLNTSAYGRS